MDRRLFIKNTSLATGGLVIAGSPSFANEVTYIDEPWFDRSMRWAQLAFVENDPNNYDPGF